MATPVAADPLPYPAATAEKAFSFISKGWREVRDSADADLRLMRARADSFKSLADRELENFINSASAFSVPARPSGTLLLPRSSSIAELEFLKRIRPKLSELRSTYSSPEFSKKVLERWGPSSRIRIDLSAIRSALVQDAEVGRGMWDLDWERGMRVGGKVRWKAEEDEEEGKEWDPFRMLKTGLRELERKSQSNEIFGNFKSSEFVERVKSSLV